MKRFLALALCLCMVLGFSGCSIGGSGGLMTSLVNFSAIESGTVESKIDLSVDEKELEEAIMKFACMSEEGSLDDYKEYKEENEEYLDEMMEEFENIPTSISINYSGKQDKDMNTTGTLSYNIGKEKGDIEVAVVEKTGYIGIKGIVDIVYLILEMSEEELAEEVSKEDILEALEDYKYLELDAEDLDLDLDMEDIEETLDMSTEDLQKLSKPVDKLLNTYCDSFITKGKSGYTLTVKLNTLEDSVRAICEKIDKNPGKFFDALVEIVKVGQEVGIIESEEMDSIEDILGSLEDLKEARKTFIEDWKDSDWDDALDEAFGTDYEEAIELLGDTNLVLTASGNKKVASLSVALNICIDSTKPCATFKVDTTMKSGKVEINASDYSGKDSISTTDIEEVLEEELTKVLAHKYIDDYDFSSDDDEDYDFDEEPKYEEEDDETYVIDTPVVSSNKNFTSMLKEGSSVNGTTAAAYYNHYKSDFLNLTYSVLPELISEEPTESIENSYGSIAVYGNDAIDGVYNDASTYMYFSDGYLVAEFETTLMGKNSEKEVDAFVNHTNSLYGFKIDNETIEDIVDNMEDSSIKEDSIRYEFEKNGLEYTIRYYEFDGYDGRPVFTLGIEAMYSF